MACKPSQACSNNMLIEQELSETHIFKQKRMKISLRTLSIKVKGQQYQNERIYHQNMPQNSFMSCANPEVRKTGSKQLI